MYYVKKPDNLEYNFLQKDQAWVDTYWEYFVFVSTVPIDHQERNVFLNVWIYSVGLLSWETHIASHHPSCSLTRSRTGNGCSQLTLTAKLQDGKEHWKQVTTENLSLS